LLHARATATSNELFKGLQFTLGQHLGFDHTANQFFDGPATKTIDDLAHSARGETACRFHCPIHISTALNVMP
jgi:hypothetical protein